MCVAGSSARRLIHVPTLSHLATRTYTHVFALCFPCAPKHTHTHTHTYTHMRTHTHTPGIDPCPLSLAPPAVGALAGFAWDSWQKGGGNWYGRVQAAIPELAALQVSHVWLPPPSRSVSKEGYLPGQLYDLDSEYGTKEQLTQLCAALKAAGISPMADIVINHR